MWRIDLTPDATRAAACSTRRIQVHGYQPFLLFDGCGRPRRGPCPNQQPIFLEPTIIFIGGGVAPPTLGVAFGTGNRAELARPNVQARASTTSSTRPDGPQFTHSTGGTSRPTSATSRPEGGRAGSLPVSVRSRTCVNGATPPQRAPGFLLDFGSLNEKTISTVFYTLGYLRVVTFTPDSVSPCATNGSSYATGSSS